MVFKEYILTCLCEEATELLEETLKSDINNLKVNENFIKELADTIAVSKMFFNTYFTFHWHSFDKLSSSNIWEEKDNLQEILFALQKYIFKALRFGISSKSPDTEKSHKDMILFYIEKILYFYKYKLSFNSFETSNIEQMIKDKIDKVEKYMIESRRARALIDDEDIFDIFTFGLTSNPTHYTISSDCPVCKGKDEECNHFYNSQHLEMATSTFKSKLTKRLKNTQRFQEVIRNCYIPLDDELKEKFKKNNISIDFSKPESNHILKYEDDYIAKPFSVTSKKDDKVVYKAPHFIKYKKSDINLKGDLYFGVSLEEYKTRIFKKDEEFLNSNKLDYAIYEYQDIYFKSSCIENVIDRLVGNAYEVAEHIKVYKPNELSQDIDEDLTYSDDD